MSDPEHAAGRHRVAVVGGGLAGITAALDLVDAGVHVVLYEARPRLGGATSSFSRDGVSVDTGQHVFLRCYSAYRRLLGRLGTAASAPVQQRFRTAVLRPGRPPAELSRSALPAPLHLARTLLGYHVLPPADRLRVLRAAGALRRVDPDDPAADATSFGDWLTAHSQRSAAIRGLWELVSVAALNAEASQVSLALAARVFRTGLLESRSAADLGIPAIPLGQLHGDPAAAALGRAGADIRLRTRVERIEARPGGGFTLGCAGSGEHGTIDVDGVVLAVPHPAAARLTPDAAVPGRAQWATLGADPIVNVHMIYSHRVTDLSHAAVVDSPVQWLFDRSGASGARGQYLAVSLSGARGHVDTPTAELRETFVPAMAALFPAAKSATLTDFFVTRERAATFHQAPGTARIRPGTRTALTGLVLAGAWTATGWPDTMEGAVRSGSAAARCLIEQFTGRVGATRPAGAEPAEQTSAGTPTGPQRTGVRR